MCAAQLDVSYSTRLERKLKRTEREFAAFYENVVKRIYRQSGSNYSKMRRSLANITSYNNPDVEVHETVDFADNYDQCAYVFAYCLIHSMLLYDWFCDLLDLNLSSQRYFSKMLYSKIISAENLNVCIIGGGPGFQTVATSKLLCNVLARYGAGKRPALKLRLTVVDTCANWKNVCETLVDSMQKKLCSRRYMEVGFNFVQADLAKDSTPDAVVEAMKEAHFVMISKFVSDAGNMYRGEKMPKLIRKITGSMSCQSSLFYLDYSGGDSSKRVDEDIDALSCFTRIYGPCSHRRYHKLNPDIGNEFSTRLFRNLHCITEATISSSAWIKIANEAGGITKQEDFFLDSPVEV